MHSCPECGAQSTTADCPVCEASMSPVDTDHFPPVSWSEVRDHMVARLLIDDEWRVDGDGDLVWWPWFLAQRISVTDTGIWDDNPDDNWLHITARVDIVEVDETVGLAACSRWNAEFPLGAFVWDDGVLSVVTTLCLNPLCRGLLDWFHEAVLAQATFAHLAASELSDEFGAPVLASAHPVSGPRDNPDELLSMFAGSERLSDPSTGPLFETALATARTVYQQRFPALGWEAGFTNEEVDFFNGERVEVAVGRVDDSAEAAQFGRGLVVWVRLTPPGVLLDDEAINNVHLALAEQPLTSLIGRLVRHDGAPEGGTQLHGYLTSGFLAQSVGDPSALAINVINAVTHCASGVTQFLREVDRVRDHD